MSEPPDAAMPPRPLHALLAGLDATQIIGDADCIVTDVVFDSRAVVPGGLFVALRGGYADGHRFIGDAAKRGAAAVLVEEAMDAPPGIRAQIVVPDTRAALAVVAANWYEHPANDLTVIGVTGTNGKTTTTTMITDVLDAAGLRSAFLGTVEIKLGPERWPNPNHQTTPESLHVQRFLRQAVAARCTHAVVEATSHGLAMHRLDALPVDVAVFTNLSHEHLE
jgi:UDP-N-acetylmuramoyl-L-alanyl-D-glutamate--2,6-diaminopimelate ligase